MAEVLTGHVWGYQGHFEWELGYCAEQALVELGLSAKPTPATIAVALSEKTGSVRVAVLEEYAWDRTAFAVLDVVYDRIFSAHPLHRMMYGDEPSMRDKPENTRRAALEEAIAEVLMGTAEEADLVTLVGGARPVDGVYIVPVLRVDRRFLEWSSFVLPHPVVLDQFVGYRSVAHAALEQVLADATAQLERPDPGRGLERERRPEELARRAARSFMSTPAIAIKDRYHGDLLERVDAVAGLLYERRDGIGKLLLVDPEHSKLRYELKFVQPVPLRDAGWARKILQMATRGVSLVANSEEIIGIGDMERDFDASTQEAFVVDFLGHHCWQLRCGDRVLVGSSHRRVFVPRPRITYEHFAGNFGRLFPRATGLDLVWRAFMAAVDQPGGSMLVVASDAATEAERLQSQATRIHPVPLSLELLRRAVEIDGTILVDPSGLCHAIGVILDGQATNACKPARGSRYNSAVRYVGSRDRDRLALVVSEDGTVDILPLLRPQVKRSEVEHWLRLLEAATLKDYHRPRKWIDENRFYFGPEQCDRANAALTRIQGSPSQLGQIVIITPPLVPDPSMNDAYFTVE